MTVLRYAAANLSVTDATPATHYYNVEGGTVIFDESWTPYLQASITVTLPMEVSLPPALDQAALDALDPRNDPKPVALLVCTLYEYDEATGTLHSQADVSAALNIESRDIDWAAGTIALALATDEFKLQQEANKTTDPVNFRAHQSSLVHVVNDVLAAAGVTATLDGNSVDADVTTTTALTNLMTDPATTFVTSPQGYAGVACSTDHTDTTWFVAGTHCVNLYTPTAAESYLRLDPGTGMTNGMTAGNTYTLSGYGNVKTACSGTTTSPATRARAITVFVTAPSLGGTVEYHSGQLPNTVGTAARVSVTFTLPADTTAVYSRAYLGHTTGQVRWNAFQLTQGDGLETDGVTPLAYFDGAKAADTYYTYAWDGSANASTSTRTPIVDRSIDSLTVSPGESYWSMLDPVLGAAGLRLFCDEEGVWRLVDGLSYAVDGTVIVQDSNATALGDSIDLTDPDDVFGSVVVKYTWTDAAGNVETSYDAAGTGSPTQLVEHDNRAYPGPGEAGYLLAKGQGRGRVMSTTALSDYSARPYQGARIIAPYTQTQTGVVSRISFDLAQAEMDVTTRGLIDTPAGAWILAPDTVTWDDASATTTWDGLDNDFSNLT
ncbi:hypothetical protein [Humibacter ginsenosidimutans]|uniref:Uncharacterized protein n=1 Tax=Humibacter ginsenosidimutans TaxID=2599293 RepID=A0A5B8M2S9_9MICO|nr:hypothetical protein [Humibacter ginsenosidimutans]QDZ14249.1 hypothetical protein FPZ11_05240 [Humibacter ginsenosidimutans]